jgi:hypothetical protein
VNTVWERFFLYESKDIISRIYYEKHNREVTSQKAGEIISHFVQGREYFKSAKQSAEVVRPLLFYYGALALSRGLILFLDTNARETSLKGSHGLGAYKWNETLANGLHELPNVKVTFSKGTFMELLTVTRNIERWQVNTAPHPNPYFGETNLETNLDGGFSITLNDILSRIPELADTYIEVFHKLPKSYQANVFILNKETQTDISIMNTIAGLPGEEVVRNEFGISPDVQITYQDNSYFLGNIHHMWFRLKHDNELELNKILPHIKNRGDNDYFIIAPLENGNRFSSLVSFFVLSYFMGMLVRYYPSQWQSLINRSKGDITFPILIKAMNVLEEKFPSLIMDELLFGTSYYKKS